MSNSGHKNIYYRNNKYIVLIQSNGKTESFGTYSTIDEAIEARDIGHKQLMENTIVFNEKYPSTFWENVKNRREILKLSKRCVAEQLGVEYNSYQGNELKGKRIPKYVDRLAEILNTTIENLTETQDIDHLPMQIRKYITNKDNMESVIQALLDYTIKTNEFDTELMELSSTAGVNLMTVGEILKQHRENLGLTPWEMCGELKISNASYYYFEVGKKIPSLSLIDRIADNSSIPKELLIEARRNEIKKKQETATKVCPHCGTKLN